VVWFQKDIFFLFSNLADQIWGSSWFLLSGPPEALIPGDKPSERWADFSPPRSECKHVWSYWSAPPILRHGSSRDALAACGLS
jgi:hypothetical protein